MSKKNKTLRNILVILIPLLLTGVLCLVTYLSRRIPMNPPGTIGNTAGNINHGGLFCQQPHMGAPSSQTGHLEPIPMAIDHVKCLGAYRTGGSQNDDSLMLCFH